jgi:hypothetical protein
MYTRVDEDSSHLRTAFRAETKSTEHLFESFSPTYSKVANSEQIHANLTIQDW